MIVRENILFNFKFFFKISIFEWFIIKGYLLSSLENILSVFNRLKDNGEFS